MTPIDWYRYLGSFGLAELPRPSEASLATLLGAYRRAVPFENMDVLIGQPISCDLAYIAHKILDGRRGGWCFEVNLLLADLLRSSGFDVTLSLARVGYRRPGLGPLSHLVLVVRSEERNWLVDAGFGGPGALTPLVLNPGEVEDVWGCQWRIDVQEPDGLTLSRWLENQWQRLYTLAPLTILPIDIEVASFFLSQWPASPFRRLLIAVAFDGQWYWCIEDRSLVQRDVHWKEVSRISFIDVGQMTSAFENRFAIHVPPHISQNVWTCLSAA